MKITEALNAIPEADRAGVIAELRGAKTVDDLAELAKKHDLDIDAKAVFDKFANTGTQEMSDDDLDAVAGGASCDSGNTTGCACSA